MSLPAIIGRRTVCVAIAVTGLVPQARAQTVEVVILGRTFRLDPRPGGPEDIDVRPFAQVRGALPADLATAPASPPSDARVLAEVEERKWIAQFQTEDALQRLATDRARRSPGSDVETVSSELAFTFYAGQGGAVSRDMQRRFDEHAALSQLAGALRRTQRQPEEPGGLGHFTVPPIPAALAGQYRQLGFNARDAYAGLRAVQAAYRSGDLALVARVIAFPLTIGGARQRTIRNAGALASVRDAVLHARVREAVARQSFADLFIRDQGAMIGNGEVWLGPSAGQFAIRTINPP